MELMAPMLALERAQLTRSSGPSLPSPYVAIAVKDWLAGSPAAVSSDTSAGSTRRAVTSALEVGFEESPQAARRSSTAWYSYHVRRLAFSTVVLAACSDYDVTRSNARDAWTQEGRDAELDILWVIDDSASMGEEQGLLAARGAAFAAPLAAAELPFRMAVTTTSATGELLGGVIDQDSADITASFTSAVSSAGVTGNRAEAGFDAALLGADPANDFARAEADLEVVIYADEDDQSSIDSADFVESLGEARDGGRSIVVSAVVGDPPNGCASATGAADAGDRYLEAQALTGGARESICASDTDGVLERLAHAVLGLRTEFTLSALPLLDSMEVTIDGVVIPRRDVDGWRYDGGDNSIIFDGWAIPRPGASIMAFYYDYTGNTAVDTGAGGTE